jgi:osmotically-inducible protein OsmY
MNVSKMADLKPFLLLAVFLSCIAAGGTARAGTALTAQDQSESDADRGTTQRIRKGVMASDTLSFTSKNATIITVDGDVTLRGAVPSSAEREELETIARREAPGASIFNEIQVDS